MKNQSAEPQFCSDLQRLDDQEIDATTNYPNPADEIHHEA